MRYRVTCILLPEQSNEWQTVYSTNIHENRKDADNDLTNLMCIIKTSLESKVVFMGDAFINIDKCVSYYFKVDYC